MEKIKVLKLVVIPKTQYDQRAVAYNFTSQVKLAKFEHETYECDDLFTLAELFSGLKHLAKIKLGAGGDISLWSLGHRGHKHYLQIYWPLPLGCNKKATMKKKTTEKSRKKEKNPKKEHSPKKEQTNENTNELLYTNVNIDSSLIKEQEQFNQIIKNQNDSQNIITTESTETKDLIVTNTIIEGAVGTVNTQQDIEIIPKNPSKEIVLKLEEIPPLDLFYCPKHRAMVKRQRKRRKIDQGILSTPQAKLMNVVWKDSEVNPSQYAGAYIATTMDKASKVSQLIKEKDLRITQLEEKMTLKQQKLEQLEQQLEEKNIIMSN